MIIVGAHSQIAIEFKKLIHPTYPIDEINSVNQTEIPIQNNPYLFCNGVLYGKSVKEMTDAEKFNTMINNCLFTIEWCNKILDQRPYARVCIIGSESAYLWSYDDVYAASKAALHSYIESKKLKTGQQIVGISPGIISDAGMTLKRHDKENLIKKENEHPKSRFLTSKEVANLAHFLLFVDKGFITNTIIRMHGGLK